MLEGLCPAGLRARRLAPPTPPRQSSGARVVAVIIGSVPEESP
ncbi:hypothetical protein KPATCC21470_0941 [Kitasatospora purpeofusca]